MHILVDQRLLLARRRSPQNEDHPLALRIDRLDHPIGEGLPTLLLMRRRRSSPHCQRCIEQEHAGTSPGLKVAVHRRRNAEV